MNCVNGAWAEYQQSYSITPCHQNNAHPSAFADPIAMESLCGVVSCNTVSAGPEAVRHLVSDWIVPSVESLPPLAVVAVMNHIAIESMAKACPVGAHDMIKTLVQPTFQCILGPILIESLPENDQHRTTALALKGYRRLVQSRSELDLSS